MAAVSAFGVEIRDLVVQVAAGASGMSAADLSKQLLQLKAAGGSGAGSAGASGGFSIMPWLQLWATLASLYYADTAIKGVLTQYAIKFPSALVGMFGVFGLLCGVGDNTANKILAFYSPALNWIARWLPIFYVPALVTLPLALQGIPGDEGLTGLTRTAARGNSHTAQQDSQRPTFVPAYPHTVACTGRAACTYPTGLRRDAGHPGLDPV